MLKEQLLNNNVWENLKHRLSFGFYIVLRNSSFFAQLSRMFSMFFLLLFQKIIKMDFCKTVIKIHINFKVQEHVK